MVNLCSVEAIVPEVSSCTYPAEHLTVNSYSPGTVRLLSLLTFLLTSIVPYSTAGAVYLLFTVTVFSVFAAIVPVLLPV